MDQTCSSEFGIVEKKPGGERQNGAAVSPQLEAHHPARETGLAQTFAEKASI